MISASTLFSSLAVALAAAAVAWNARLRRALKRQGVEIEKARLFEKEREELLTLRGSQAAWQEQWRVLQAQSRETQRELGSLTYSVSHDLRAPLRGIDGFAQALAEDYSHCLDATALDYLRRVRGNATQMSALIDDLLTLSRVARAPFQEEPLDLSGLVDRIAAELQALEPSRRVRWEVQRGVAASGDRDLVQMALRQLLANAWKFTAHQPEARIGFRVQPPSAGGFDSPVFQVNDNGAGFDMQYAGKLFGAFQRMHPPEEFPGGRGIGLALVQRIVHRHSGNVWAEAVPEQGATFSFTLGGSMNEAPTPAEANEAETPLPASSALDAPPTTPRPKTTAV